MRILPRREPAAAEVVDDADAELEAEQAPANVTLAKGRPTPKRRESTVKRGPVSAPKTRKEALARQKQQRQEARTAQKSGRPVRGSGVVAAPLTPAERREALKRGDPAYLPRRDQGKTRKLARDYVDSHRMFSNYLLVLFPIMLVSYLIPFAQIVVLVLFVLLLGEWYITGRKLNVIAAERGYERSGGNFGIGFYAGSRAYLPRRWRLPAPQVSLGDPI